MSTSLDLVPCVICTKLGRTTLTPIETICHVRDAERTLCPDHRNGLGGLLSALTDLIVADGKARLAERAREVSEAAA